jgi:CRISPR-associated protein Cas2
MPMHQTKLFLLAYDIADPARLQQVHRTVKAVGIPVQYSVFLIPADAEGVDALLSRLDAIIEPKLDDVRVYPLPQRLDVTRYGRQNFPIGVELALAEQVQAAFISIVGPSEVE